MVKQLRDYVEQVQKKFPYLTQFEISKILSWGLQKYTWVNRMHGDVLFKNLTEEPMTIHCGSLGYDTFKQYFRWVVKWRMKERILFKLKRKKWDGFYYIGLNNEQHKKLKNNRKIKTFRDVYFTKLEKELYHNKLVTHIWRVPYIEDCGWKFFVTKYTTDKAEYVGPNKYEKYHTCFLNNKTDATND